VDKIPKTKIQDKQVKFVVSTSFELLLNISENLNQCIQCENKDSRETGLNIF
jgi:hypothetical protein